MILDCLKPNLVQRSVKGSKYPFSIEVRGARNSRDGCSWGHKYVLVECNVGSVGFQKLMCFYERVQKRARDPLMSETLSLAPKQRTAPMTNRDLILPEFCRPCIRHSPKTTSDLQHRLKYLSSHFELVSLPSFLWSLVLPLNKSRRSTPRSWKFRIILRRSEMPSLTQLLWQCLSQVVTFPYRDNLDLYIVAEGL